MAKSKEFQLTFYEITQHSKIQTYINLRTSYSFLSLINYHFPLYHVTCPFYFLQLIFAVFTNSILLIVHVKWYLGFAGKNYQNMHLISTLWNTMYIPVSAMRLTTFSFFLVFTIARDICLKSASNHFHDSFLLYNGI